MNGRTSESLRGLRRRWRESSDASFVETVFRGVLGRSPDTGGLSHYVNRLHDGHPRSEVLNAVVESTEAARHHLYSPGQRGLIEEFWTLRQQPDHSIRPLCFLHIMKTGGTSLGQALAEMASPWPRLGDLFCDHILCLPPPLLAQAMLIVGHLPYEVVALLPSNIAVCTVLRDPVERTLSHHAHVAGPTLDEFLSDRQWRPLWENYQARQLVHRIGLGEAWRTYSPRQRAASRNLSAADTDYPLQSLFDSTPLSIAPDELLPAALASLDRVDIVGATEDLPSVLSQVAGLWKTAAPPTMAHLRVSEKRVARSDVPGRLLALIEEGTVVDRALHVRARDAARTA